MQGLDVERIRIDDWSWSCECAFCGEYFVSRRSDASFCSAKHRVYYNRLPAQERSAAIGISEMSWRLNEIANKFPHSENLFSAMLEMRKELDKTIAKFEK